MDLGLTEQQEMLKLTTRDFLDKECPKSVVREMMEDERGYPPELWRKMADLGWMGLVFPGKYGGLEGDFFDLVVLLEEMGRACLPGPFFSTVVLGGLAILAAGTEKQKQALLPKIADGKMIITLALMEPNARYDALGVRTRATAGRGEYVINGTKLFVENAHIADYILCLVRTSENKTAEEGLTLFLVDSKSAGIRCTLLNTLAADKQCEVVFEDVRVPTENILGEPNQGWAIVERLLEQATVAKCAEMIGGAQATLEMAVNYAKERVQFGRPIGSFQAIQHHCANMVTEISGARFITYKAAWMVSEQLPAAMEVAMAKIQTGHAYQQATVFGHQIFGAIGFCMDHDMHLYYRRAKAGEISFGDSDFYREKVAQELGL
jgi:alkylation response protein AidB-like acyl-CoA dehydrogenase